MIINPSKCEFARSNLNFLGYNISKDGIAPSKQKVEVLLKIQKPKTIQELRRFIAMCNFYRRFIKDAAKKMVRLFQLLAGAKKNDKRPVNWCEITSKDFEDLKESLANATTLCYPDARQKLSIATDASDFAIGGVLQQDKGDNNFQPIAFFSRKLNKAQCNYSTYDRELLAIYESIRHFRHFIEARPFTIYTDHRPLIYALTKKNKNNETPRQARQLDYISQYTSDIKYVQGDLNVVADTLSRLDIDMVEGPENISLDLICEEQKKDEDLNNLFKNNNTSLKLIKLNFQGLQIIFDNSKEILRPYIPKSLQRRYYNSIHNMNHAGVRAMIKTIGSKGTWVNMRTDVTKWTKLCLPCQKNKINKHVRTPILRIKLPEAKFATIHADIVGPLIVSEGMRYLFTIIDRFSRWTEAIPIPDLSSSTIIRALYDGWICRFGLPEKIVTDQGRSFLSSDFQNFCTRMGIKHSWTTAYHPQSNGMIERFHRTLKTAIKSHFPIPWTKSLSTILYGLRTVINEQADYSIAQMVYGTTIKIPADFMCEKENILDLDPNHYTKQLISYIKQLKPREVKHHNKENVFIFKDMDTATHMFVRNDKVYKPLETNYLGPFKVCCRTQKTITLDVDGEPKIISKDRLKPAYIEVAPDVPLSNQVKQPDYVTRYGRPIFRPNQ